MYGLPDPTGADCPPLPQLPPDSVHSKSRPIMSMFSSVRNRLPERLVPLSGSASLPSRIIHASAHEKPNCSWVVEPPYQSLTKMPSLVSASISSNDESPG